MIRRSERYAHGRLHFDPRRSGGDDADTNLAGARYPNLLETTALLIQRPLKAMLHLTKKIRP